MCSMKKPIKPKYIELETHIEAITRNGEIFLIDKDDLYLIEEYHWCVSHGYAKNSKLGTLHRYLMEDQLSKELEVDHINRNRLDNRRSNLRVITRIENMHNKSKYNTNSSGHVGVKWNKTLKKWQAQINVDGKRKHLGVFENLQDAIIKRRLAEKEIWGIL